MYAYLFVIIMKIHKSGCNIFIQKLKNIMLLQKDLQKGFTFVTTVCISLYLLYVHMYMNL